MRRLLLTTTLLGSLSALTLTPGVAHAQDINGGLGRWLDLFDPNMLVQRAMQSGIMALRTQMDMTYAGMSVDLLGGKIAISEVSAWPLPEWDDEGTCEINIDQLVLRSAPLMNPEIIQLKAQVIGAAFPTSCLPPEAQEPLGALGVAEVSLPRMTVDMAYGLPASDLSVRLHADLMDLAVLDLNLDFAYFWFDGREDMNDPVPIVFLDQATLSLENHGLFSRVASLLPPPLTAEGSGQFVEGALGQALAEANGGTPMSDAQSAFVASAAAAWPAFVADPQTLVLETTNDGDVFLDIELIESDPRELFDPLQPIVSLVPRSRSEVLSISMLDAAMTDPATLSIEDRKRVGLALISGRGVPRNLTAGLELLEGFALQNDGESAAALAAAAADSDPETAYRWALVAGVSGQKGMTTLMNALEARLPFDQVLVLQSQASAGDRYSSRRFNSISSIRTEAAKHHTGNGRKRSYERAAVYALLGAAAGDLESADILADIEERARLAGPDGLAAWAEIEAIASERAMAAWLDNDLAARFAQ